MQELIFNVDKDFDGTKAVDFIKKQGVSDEIIKKVKFGNVFINGEVLQNVNNKVFCGDTVKIILPLDKQNPYITPIKGKIDIIYEDDYILAVNKPKGMLTHSSKFNKTPALDQLVCGYFSPSPFTFRAINRLDKDTSGIVLIAKDIFTASLLGEQIKENKIVKTYSALVKGAPQQDEFVIEKPIDRQNPNQIKRVCSPTGKYAKSECVVVKRLSDGNSIIDVKLITGRTHQIRVHLSSIGFPLYADSLYGESVQGKTYSLCAKKLEFVHPITKKELVIKIDEQ